MARIVIPLREDVSLIPGIQVLRWVGTAVLHSGDPEDQRPVVVVVVRSHDDQTTAAAFGRFP